MTEKPYADTLAEWREAFDAFRAAFDEWTLDTAEEESDD